MAARTTLVCEAETPSRSIAPSRSSRGSRRMATTRRATGSWSSMDTAFSSLPLVRLMLATVASRPAITPPSRAG
eukprot:scaffold28807_cov67-Phaeocystis_antarctica.AAC.3